MKSKLITLFLLLVTIGSITSAQGIKEEISLKYGATNEGKRQDPAMQKFRDNRLGAFIIGDCMPFLGVNGTEKCTVGLLNG